METIGIVILSNVAMVVSGLVLFFRQWFQYIRPDMYKCYRIFKNDFLTYTDYYFFHPIGASPTSHKIAEIIYDHSDVKPYIMPSGVYCWTFMQGQAKPIKYSEDPDHNIDGKLVTNLKNQTLDDLWSGGNSIEDFLKTYGIILIGVLIIILFMYLINKDQTTTQMLRNISMMR